MRIRISPLLPVNIQEIQDLRLELGAMVDAGMHFVNASYYLEGDKPLIFTCSVSVVCHAVEVDH